MTQHTDSIEIEDVTNHIDSLIQRGLQRVETENPNVASTDYLRLLELSPNMRREDDPPEVIDDLENVDLENVDLPEAA